MVDAQAPSARRLIDAERGVHRILRARFTAALLELGVSFAQFEVMELLDDASKLHPGEIGRRLLITRQSADHLVHQLRRGSLVDTWRLDGGSLGVELASDGRRRMDTCGWASDPRSISSTRSMSPPAPGSATTSARAKTPSARSTAPSGTTPEQVWQHGRLEQGFGGYRFVESDPGKG